MPGDLPEFPAIASSQGSQLQFQQRAVGFAPANPVPYARLPAVGAADDAAAKDRYAQLMETQSTALPCYFNLVTAMSRSIFRRSLPSITSGLIRDNAGGQAPKQDRFFARTDAKMADQVAQAAAHGEFAPEVGTAPLHTGATGSWKQAQFGEAKCAAGIRENQRPDVNGIDGVVAEPDIDYYKDLLAHAIPEVVPNGSREL
jgi:hypothetical protein